MKKSMIQFVQQQLNRLGYDAGKADGVAGIKTLSAIDVAGVVEKDWRKSRKVIGFIQWLANENNIDAGKVDGYMGPQTEYALEQLRMVLDVKTELPLWRPEDRTISNPNGWPSQKTDQSLNDYFGTVGENQTRIQLPYPHKLSWNRTQTVKSYFCNKMVHDSLLRVLTNVFDYYGIEQIKKLRLDLFGGCLNVRKMRGGSRYSMHSWGIAVDYDPDHNAYKWGRDKASFALPDYEKWWQFWEAEGWVSLGRTRNYDWMHVQAAQI